MSETRVLRCPKCSGEMDIGYLDGTYFWMAGTSHWKLRPNARVLAYACKNCGYVEFYLEKKGAKP